MASKSQQIAALVAQLKAGSISKAQLFEELQRLKGEPSATPMPHAFQSTSAAGSSVAQGPTVATSAAPRAATSQPPEATNSSSSEPLTRSSVADQSEAQSSAAQRRPSSSQPQQTENNNAAGRFELNSRGSADGSAAVAPSRTSIPSSSRLRGPQASASAPASANSLTGGGATSARRRPDAQQQKQQKTSPMSQQAVGSRARTNSRSPQAADNGADNSSPSASAAANNVASGGSVNASYATGGQPQQPSPGADAADNGGSSSPSGRSQSQQQQQYRNVLDSIKFSDRIRAWEEHKREEAARRAAEAAQRETAECTFRPAINRNSAAIATEKYGLGSGSSPSHHSSAAAAAADGLHFSSSCSSQPASAGHFSAAVTASSSGGAAAAAAAAAAAGRQALNSSVSGGSTAGGGASGAGGPMSVHERLYLASTPASKGHQRSAIVTSGARGQQLLYSAAGGDVSGTGGGGDLMTLDGQTVFAAVEGSEGTTANSNNGRRRASSVGVGGRPATAPSPSPSPSPGAVAFLSGGRPLFTSPATGYPRDAPGSYRLPTASELQSGNRPMNSREEEELLRECTFKPKVNPVVDARPVRSRYMDALASPGGSNAGGAGGRRASFSGGAAGGGKEGVPLPSGLEHCTFKPKTNSIKPSAMPAAALYVQAPIYERLARTQTAAQAAREYAVANGVEGLSPPSPTVAAAAAAQSPLSSPTHAAGVGSGGVNGSFSASSTLSASGGIAQLRPYSHRRGSSAGGGGGGDVSVGGSATAITSARDKEERERAHAEFLARQEELLRRKERTAAEIAAATAPPLEPELCRKSLQIVASTGRESFLARVQREGARKVAEMKTAQASAAPDPECTFTPAINPSSKQLPGRSAVELSRGDALRRETSQRLLKMRVEAEMLEDVTFRPSINEKSRAAEGRLRVLEDPAAYVARLQQEAAVAAEKAQRAAAETAAAELAECTFKPVVNEAPAYIHRIASSMALARAVKQAERPQEPARPDWR